MIKSVKDADLELGRKDMLGGGVGAAIAMVVDHARGASLWDATGREYIDCTSQAWSLNVGHCHPRVVAAVTEQVQKFTHIRTSFDTVPKLLLAKKLSELGPGRLKKVSFCLTGSDANEGAVKLALRNRSSDLLVTLWDGYHGRTLATINMSWPHPNNRFTAWGGPVLRVPQAYCYRCPFELSYPSCGLECVRFARQTIEHASAEPPAALMMEAMQDNGGMIDFPADYHQAMRRMCDELGMLLIYDEIQTGFGRVGDWFACSLYDVEPDIMVIGKGLGGGFPIFGTLSREGPAAQAGPQSHCDRLASRPRSCLTSSSARIAAIRLAPATNPG